MHPSGDFQSISLLCSARSAISVSNLPSLSLKESRMCRGIPRDGELDGLWTLMIWHTNQIIWTILTRIYFDGCVEECCVVRPWKKASERYVSFHQSVITSFFKYHLMRYFSFIQDHLVLARGEAGCRVRSFRYNY